MLGWSNFPYKNIQMVVVFAYLMSSQNQLTSTEKIRIGLCFISIDNLLIR
jgi:hypothetical protein